MKNSIIRAVAFDFDGLMFDTERLWEIVGDTILGRRGHTMRKEVGIEMMGRKSEDALSIMKNAYQLDDSGELLQAESAEIFLSVAEQAKPMPGFETLLAALIKAEIPCALTTSSRAVLVEPILKKWELTDKFVFQLTSQDIANGKPNPEIYLTAAESFGVRPEEMIVLEDSQVGCAAGVAAKAMTVAVRGNLVTQRGYSGASLVVDSLEDRRIYAALGLLEND